MNTIYESLGKFDTFITAIDSLVKLELRTNEGGVSHISDDQ